MHEPVGGKFEAMENGDDKSEYVHFRGRLCHHLESNNRKTKGLLRRARERGRGGVQQVEKLKFNSCVL